MNRYQTPYPNTAVVSLAVSDGFAFGAAKSCGLARYETGARSGPCGK